MVEESVRELMADIILVAYEDYRMFKRHGLIVKARVIAGRKVRAKNAKITDVSSAVWFFWQGGVEIAAELGGLNMDVEAIKRKLEPEAYDELQAEREAR
jgi:hypothetical protein